MRVEFAKSIDFPLLLYVNNKQLTLTRFSFMSIGRNAIVQRFFTEACVFNNAYFLCNHEKIKDKIVLIKTLLYCFSKKKKLMPINMNRYIMNIF